MKIKRQNKAAVEAELAKALERLEIEESTADELKKAHLMLRRAMQKVRLLFLLESPHSLTSFLQAIAGLGGR